MFPLLQFEARFSLFVFGFSNYKIPPQGRD